MARRGDLDVLRDIGAVRMIQVDMARQYFGTADERWSQAVRQRDDASEASEEAARNWLNLVRSSAPDPMLMSISARSLVAREAELRTADLREGIAQRGRDNAASLLAARQAELDAATEIAARVRKTLGKASEERHAREMDDSYLRRRSR